MKQRYSYWLLMFLILPLLVGCISSSPPDIVLKDNGQPCISIPSDEFFFKKNKQFTITGTGIAQVGVGQLSSKFYHDPSKPYYVKTQECIDFDYHFQNNISYSIGFISIEKGTDDNKSWSRYLRINKNQDGTVQLLLDGQARDAI
ncbi:putative T6SS immunity periplasmic lipoprotein [Snodgrassella communis]|uniref:putative T6SS immunity periplasmic lipoprotein n=1 Tax=Snodgrassella communis TaxID=2946699 RepID=UPI001EF5D3D4|nr:putative T6SS immunity periplasmic lipoprotein [Snodgrassella communis]